MSFEIVDIRQLAPRAFAPLLDVEVRAWFQKLRWDYVPSAKLISSCLAERRLSGFALVQDEQPRGYCFFFIEASKGLIGDLFVEPDGPALHHAQHLLECSIEALVEAPGLSRVEAQLPHFTMEQLETCFRSRSFQAYPRQFMALPLQEKFASGPSPAALPPHENPCVSPSGEFQIEPWTRKHDRDAAQLVYETYRRHVDSLLNDQYSSLDGAARLIDNITRLQGCGEFLPQASRVAIHLPSRKLAGILAMTRVRSGTAHIPQVAVRAEFQQIGLGTSLLEGAFAELAHSGYSEVSLTVTALNAGAVRLYERLGFRTFHAFGAFVWQRP